MLPSDGQQADTDTNNWFVTANKNIALIPQLESEKGAENAEAILSLPEVDVASKFSCLK